MSKKIYIIRAEMIEEAIMNHLEKYENANYNDLCQTSPTIENYCSKHDCNCSLDLKCAKITVTIHDVVFISGLAPATIGQAIQFQNASRLRSYEDRIETYRNEVEHARKVLTKRKNTLDDYYQFVLRELFGSEKSDKMHLEVGTWDCEKSPGIKKCVYNDGNKDECIFCGEPEERQ